MTHRVNLFGNAEPPQSPYHDRGFIELLFDAIGLAYRAADFEADENDRLGECMRFARASILNCLLLPECAANACVDTMTIQRAQRDDLDKLPTSGKFDVFLLSLGRQMLDRGSAAVQGLSELKSLRDSIVHAKVVRTPWQATDEPWVFTADAGVTQMLEISKRHSARLSSDAVSALRAATAFFDHYFLHCCGFNSNQVCEILLSSGPPNLVSPASSYVDGSGEMDRAIRDWNMSFRFLGKS